MKCEFCDTENNDWAIRCIECGRPLLTKKDKLMGAHNEDEDLSKQELELLDSWRIELQKKRDNDLVRAERWRVKLRGLRYVIPITVAIVLFVIGVILKLYPLQVKEFIDWVNGAEKPVEVDTSRYF